MCTVSFIARPRGYLLAMNRDEQLRRVRGLPPKIMVAAGHRIVRPMEPSGGTWIALNDVGVTFALINWYSIGRQVKSDPISRGQIVNFVSAQCSPGAAAEILASQSLVRVNPFRLIGVFPETQELVEWSWNLKELVGKPHAWRTQQFISSGYDEPMAQRLRSATFRRALRQKSAGTREWLRRLHRSHAPESGPFSICMHRSDAATVSCTEVAVTKRMAKMVYRDLAPCERLARSTSLPFQLVR
jgi:hypothetical protein